MSQKILIIRYDLSQFELKSMKGSPIVIIFKVISNQCPLLVYLCINVLNQKYIKYLESPYLSMFLENRFRPGRLIEQYVKLLHEGY